MSYNEGKGVFKVQTGSTKAVGFHLDLVSHGYVVLIMLSECVLL